MTINILRFRDKVDFNLSPAITLSLIILLGLSLRFLCIYVMDIKPVSDYFNYLTMASNLYDGKGLLDFYGNRAIVSAGYPLFLYCIFLIFGKSIIAAQCANVLLGGLSIFLVYLLGKETFRSSVVAALGAFFWAIYLPSILYTEYLAKENLMIPLFLLTLLLIAKYNSPKIPISILASLGLLLGIQAIVGPSVLAICPIIVFQILTIKNSIKRKIFTFAILITCMAISLAPWLYRNYLIFGRPLLSTFGGFNLYIGNNPSATGMFVSITDTPLGKNWGKLRKEYGEAGFDNYLKELAIKYIVSHPSRTIGLSLKKCFLFWYPPVHEGKGSKTNLESISRFLWLLQYSMLMIFALVSLLFIRLKLDRAWILYASIILYTGIHMIFVVIFRYRLTIMPVVCLLAAYSLSMLYNFFKKRNLLNNR